MFSEIPWMTLSQNVSCILVTFYKMSFRRKLKNSLKVDLLFFFLYLFCIKEKRCMKWIWWRHHFVNKMASRCVKSQATTTPNSSNYTPYSFVANTVNLLLILPAISKRHPSQKKKKKKFDLRVGTTSFILLNPSLATFSNLNAY